MKWDDIVGKIDSVQMEHIKANRIIVEVTVPNYCFSPESHRNDFCTMRVVKGDVAKIRFHDGHEVIL